MADLYIGGIGINTPGSGGGGGGGVTGVTAGAPLASSGGASPNITLAPSGQAQGDILYFNGTNWVRLAAGTAGNVLQTQGAGANPQWSAAGTGTVSNVTAISPIVSSGGTTPNITMAVASQAQGDILYFNGTSWVRLGSGTSGQFLQTQGASANPHWASGNAGTVTSVTATSPIASTGGATPVLSMSIASQAQGDLLYFNGTDWVRLGSGTSGQFLQTQGASADPLWASGNAGTVTSVTATSPISSTGGTTPVLSMAVASQAQGDVLYFNGTNWVRLPSGTSGQFLQTQGSAANPQWASGNAGTVTSVTATSPISSTGGTTPVLSMTVASQAQGDVLYFNGTDWVRLGAGTSGQFLQTQGASANPQWAAGGAGTVTSVTASSPISSTGGTTPVLSMSVASQAQGDILYFNGTNWVRLAAGTSGNVLQTQGAGANPQWAAAGSSSLAITTTTNTTIPAVGSTVTVAVSDTTALLVGFTVVITDLTNVGTFSITAIGSTTSLTGKFVNADGDSAVGAVIASGAKVYRPNSVTFAYVSSTPVTFYNLPDLKSAEVILTGGGGGGGGGGVAAAGGSKTAGAGGGGGFRARMKYRMSDLSSTVTVTLGAGGTSGAGRGTAGGGTSGGTGGTSSFGAYLYAYGGGGGSGGLNSATASTGGGGGGSCSAGVSASAGANSGYPGGPAFDIQFSGSPTAGTILLFGIAGNGAWGYNQQPGYGAEWGGGSGGSTSFVANVGGISIWGGAGGGSGGGMSTGNAPNAGGQGGGVGSNAWAITGFNAGGGGTAGTSSGGTGGNGAADDTTKGGTGAGGGGSSTTTGGAGGTGGRGGGGGGGGGAATGTSGAGGVGGQGTCYVICT